MTVSEIRDIMRRAQLARWSHLRKLGAARFVLLYGVIAWGLPMFILFAFLVPDQPALHGVDLRFGAILLCLVVLGGVSVGWSEWRRREENYREDITREATPKA